MSSSTPPTPETPRRPKTWSPVVIAGPSGVGKGTLISSLHKRHPGLFTKCVSHTTRAPRAGEVDGHDYNFVSREAFSILTKLGKFIEYTEFSGNLYGTSKAALALQKHSEGQILLLDIDVNGVETLLGDATLTSTVQPRCVFVRTQNMEALEQRLRGRGTETEEKIQQRLARAKEELDLVEARPSLFDKVIYNDNLEDAIRELEDFIFE